jgi:predicted nucleic acid-binding protein
MPRSAVVDTSVLVSAFLFPHSVPGRVVALAEQGGYALHFSPIILEELRRSLRNPRLRNAYKYAMISSQGLHRLVHQPSSSISGTNNC